MKDCDLFTIRRGEDTIRVFGEFFGFRAEERARTVVRLLRQIFPAELYPDATAYPPSLTQDQRIEATAQQIEPEASDSGFTQDDWSDNKKYTFYFGPLPREASVIIRHRYPGILMTTRPQDGDTDIYDPRICDEPVVSDDAKKIMGRPAPYHYRDEQAMILGQAF